MGAGAGEREPLRESVPVWVAHGAVRSAAKLPFTRVPGSAWPMD